jgi:hypothetical protein
MYLPNALTINKAVFSPVDSIYGLRMILSVNSCYFFKHLIFLMHKRYVSFEEGTAFVDYI